MTDEPKLFQNDDAGYEDWVDHNGGYVLIVRSGGDYMLHDSDCSHLGRDGDVTLELTKKPRHWAKDRRMLAAWAEAGTGRKPLLCQSCR
jgi:hypothetical protein